MYNLICKILYLKGAREHKFGCLFEFKNTLIHERIID